MKPSPADLRQPGKVTHLTIEANTSPCVNICRYCYVGDRDETFAKFPVDRWMAFVQRFVDWKAQAGEDAPVIHHGFPGPSYNFDLDTYRRLNDWFVKRFDEPLASIMLGGLKMRPGQEMRQWLAERQALGLKHIHASFSGFGAHHDRWVGKRGEFEFLLQTFRCAIELGLQVATTLFVTKSSLPDLERLADTLDALVPAPPMFKHIRLVYYMGNGAHQEHERITEDDRTRLPEFVAKSLEDGVEIHSEREWIPRILSGAEAGSFANLWLKLKLTPRNIERLEAMSCEAIVAELEAAQRAYESGMPRLEWLAQHYADPAGTRIYMKYDVFKVWQERYIEAAGIEVPRPFMNKTLRPPPLRNVEWYAMPRARHHAA